MKIKMLAAALLAVWDVQSPALAASAKAPTAVGSCVATTIKEIGNRLEGMDDSGSLVVYATGTYGVSYDTIEGIVGSKVGDKVELCLVSLPEDCPAGDERGKVYAAVNLRTQAFWELPDAEHMCGPCRDCHARLHIPWRDEERRRRGSARTRVMRIDHSKVVG